MAKQCTGCLETKEAAGFYSVLSIKSGLSSRCRKCTVASSLAYYEKNRKAADDYRRQWKEDNQEKVLQRRREFYARNRERLIAVQSARQRANPHLVSIAWRKRLAKVITPKWADLDKMRVVYEKAKQFGMQVDHVVPIQSPIVCGLHTWHNLQLLAKSENVSKGNRSWPEMP